jgi:hypothetical protein
MPRNVLGFDVNSLKFSKEDKKNSITQRIKESKNEDE